MNKKQAFISVVSYALAILFLIMLFYSKKFTQTSVTPISKKIIIIDAGHGIPDGGAVSKSGVKESELNLSIANELKKILMKNGATVVMTRNGKTSLSNSKTNNKKEDMQKRKEIINNIKADVFISIHMNYFSDSKYYGAQVFYNGIDLSNKNLANYIQQQLIDIGHQKNTRKIKEDNTLYILKDSPVPSVLIECGFLSNESEAKRLNSRKYQKQIANAIYKGVMDFFKHNIT